jgi:glutamate synthase (NADPH/NADH) small chain
MKLEMNRAHKSDVAGKRIIVVGGGNTAIDVARECALLGAGEISMLYRRSEKEMSGYEHELDGARLESVRFLTHLQPVAFVRGPKNELIAIRVAKTDANAKPIAGSEHDVPCDMVALAIGQSKLRAVAKELTGVELDAKGCVVADASTCVTGNPKVFAGGDCINGGKEVVNAVADGRNAARFLMSKWKGQ